MTLFWKQFSWRKNLEMSRQQFPQHIALFCSAKTLDFELCSGLLPCQACNLGLAICHLWWVSSSLYATLCDFKEVFPQTPRHPWACQLHRVLLHQQHPWPLLTRPQETKARCKLDSDVQIWSTVIQITGCERPESEPWGFAGHAFSLAATQLCVAQRHLQTMSKWNKASFLDMKTWNHMIVMCGKIFFFSVFLPQTFKGGKFYMFLPQTYKNGQ